MILLLTRVGQKRVLDLAGTCIGKERGKEREEIGLAVAQCIDDESQENLHCCCLYVIMAPCRGFGIAWEQRIRNRLRTEDLESLGNRGSKWLGNRGFGIVCEQKIRNRLGTEDSESLGDRGFGIAWGQKIRNRLWTEDSELLANRGFGITCVAPPLVDLHNGSERDPSAFNKGLTCSVDALRE